MRKLLVAALLLIAALAVGTARGALPSGNLVINPGAEDGGTPVQGWSVTGTFTAEQYPAPGPAERGANFFSGGAQPPSSAVQTVDLSAARKAIDAGRMDARVGVLVGGAGTLSVSTNDGAGHMLSQRNLKGSGAAPVRIDELIPIPPKARSATLTMKASDQNASFDNVSFLPSRRRLPRPERGKSVLVDPAQGATVLLRRGNRKIITRPTLVPLGSMLDTSKGTATIVSADDRYGAKTEHGSFSEGAFTVAQAGRITNISLGGRDRSCTHPRRLVSRATSSFTVLAGASASRPARVRAVWVADDRCTETMIKAHRGRVDVMQLGSRTASGGCRVRSLFSRGHGRFQTRGRGSSATVRGKATSGYSARIRPPEAVARCR